MLRRLVRSRGTMLTAGTGGVRGSKDAVNKIDGRGEQASRVHRCNAAAAEGISLRRAAQPAGPLTALEGVGPGLRLLLVRGDDGLEGGLAQVVHLFRWGGTRDTG